MFQKKLFDLILGTEDGGEAADILVEKLDYTLLKIMKAAKILLVEKLSLLTSSQVDSIIGMEDAGVTATMNQC